MIIKKLNSVLTIGMAVAAMAFVGPNVQAQNLLGNGGFESELGPDDSVPTDTFATFTGGPERPSLSTVAPNSGTQHLTAQILGVDATFVGIQQGIDNIIAGEEYTFSFFARGDGPVDLNAEFRIEYLNELGEFAEDQFTNNQDIAPALTDTYAEFSQTNTAPEGAVSARAIFALATFNAGTDTGTVFLDDASFTGVVSAAVPEPSSLGLMAAGLIGLATRRRRS